MMRRYITGMLVSLLYATLVHAGGDEKKTMLADNATYRAHWRSSSLEMTPGEYSRMVHHNRDIVQEQLEVYADRLLDRAGSYGRAAGLFGAAVAVAATDRRYNLNDSKTLGMVLRDTVSSDRAVLLEYRAAW